MGSAKKTRRLVHWILPAKLDRYIFVSGLLFFIGIFYVENSLLNDVIQVDGSHQWFALFPVGIVSLALATSLGCIPFRQMGRRWWMIAVWVACFAFLFWHISRLKVGIGWSSKLVVLIALSCAAFFLAKICDLILGWLKRRFAIGKLTTTKLLIGMAIFLFAASIISRSFHNEWITPGNLVNSPVALALPVFYLLFVFVPCWLIHRVRGWQGPLLGAMAISGICIPFSLAMIMSEGHQLIGSPLLGVITMVYGAILLFLSSVLIRERGKTKYAQPESNLPPAQEPKLKVRNRSRVGPSIWGWAMYLAFALFVSFSISYDPLTFIAPEYSISGAPATARKSLAHRFAISRYSRNIQIKTGASSRLVSANSPALGNLSILDAEFSTDTAPSYFEILETVPTGTTIVLNGVNFQPHLNTKPFIGRSVAIQLTGGQITTSQLLDMSPKSMHINLGKVEVLPSEGETRKFQRSCGLINTWASEPGTAEHLLPLIGEDYNKPINLSGDFSQNDWKQIIKLAVAEKTMVISPTKNVILELPQLLADEGAALKFLMINMPANDPSIWKIKFECPDVNLVVSSYQMDSIATYWEAIFAGTKKHSGFYSSFGSNRGDVSNQFRELHWAYDDADDPNQPIRKLWLPDSISNSALVSNLPELETLSIRGQWLLESPLQHEENFFDHELKNFLPKLTKLKELRLPMEYPFLNWKLAQSLPDLERLEFNAEPTTLDDGGNAIVIPVDFQASYFPSLKHLTVLGPPSKRVIKEMSKISTLESFSLLVTNDEIIETQEANLQKLFGDGVKVRVREFYEAMEEIPEDFQRHLEKTRKQIREKHLGQESEKKFGNESG